MAKKVGSTSVEAPRPGPELVVVSRAWMLGLAALILVPWLLAAWLHFGRSPAVAGGSPREAPAPASAAAGTVVGSPGPWGQIQTTPIVISPPLEYIPEDPEPPASRAAWVLPRARRSDLERLLEEAGVGPPARDSILATAREDPAVGGVVAFPDLATVEALGPGSRERIYLGLARFAENPRQQNAFRFFGGSPDEWLRNAPLRPETVQLVRPLVYRHEGFLLFADIDVARARIADAHELRRLTKVLFREATLLVKLRIPGEADVEAIAEYWGRGGRRVDLRPLLESAAAAGPDFPLDVVHLLPVFARERLYRYPRVSLADLDRPGIENCFWTALNFFAERPDDRLLDAREAMAALKRDYYFVHENPQLGDVVVFSGEDGEPYHAAVWVADGIVFGKNGTSTLSPWTLLPIERLRGYYPRAAAGSVAHYRRKGL